MSKAIITYAAGAHEELLDIALPEFRVFAAKHGYELIVGKKLVDMPPAWNKVALIADGLRTFDQVLWLDCDLVIVDNREDLPGLPPGASHSLVRHFAEGSEVPNTGVWLVNRAALPLLEKMFELEVFWNHGWWEQAALLTMMGYCVPAEGSNFREVKCRCVHETRWTRECSFMRVQWNSHPSYRAEKPKIVHCTYPDMLQRIEVMRALVKDPQYDYPAYFPKEDEKG